MIRIGTPHIYEDGQYAYLKAKIDISQDTVEKYIAASKVIKKVHWRTNENYPPHSWAEPNGGLWFAVPLTYKQYLCANRSDAFVVAMLWYAMVTGSDIEVETPMSERMAFHVQHYLIPALCRPSNGYRRIKLVGPTSGEPCKNEGGVGTGMSCGVDSIYTLQEYTRPDVPDSFQLTHLTYFNMGAIFHPNRAEKKQYTIEEFYDTTDRMSEEKCGNAQQVADKSGLPLVYVKSNLDKDYYRGAYGHTGVYRNCAMALSLQGLFSKYLCSSGGWPDYFDLTLTEGSEHYESLLCSCLSTESLSFILSDYATRAEKTIAIADNPLAQKYLDVCFCFNSCGHCTKCRRTLVTLDVFDKIDNFEKVFDIDDFKQHRVDNYVWLMHTKDGDQLDDNAVFAKDLYRIASERGKIPQEAIAIYKKQKHGGLRGAAKRLLRPLLPLLRH